MFGPVAIEFALCGLPKGFSREVPKMCFDGVARVSRAAAQLAFFVAVALDVYQGKAIWNVYIDSLFLNALPVPMLATGLEGGRARHFRSARGWRMTGSAFAILIARGTLFRLWLRRITP